MQTPLDDSQLLRLAADPRVRLFPEPSITKVLAPLVILMSWLPALAIALTPGLDETSARWGLRALDAATAGQLSDWLEPGVEGFGKSLAYQPPLSSWLHAAVVHALGVERPESWHVVSLLSSCGCVLATYRLARRLGGASFSLVVVACLSCHPLTLHFATGTTPGSLGMLLIVVSVWGLLGHLEGPPTWVSSRLLVGALAWGLAVLAVGPVALALLLPLLFYVGGLRESSRLPAGSPPFSGISCDSIRGVTAILIFVATGLTLSAWWEAMMHADQGVAFWDSWWTGRLLHNASAVATTPDVRSWLDDNVFLCGWLVIGLSDAIRQVRHPTSELSRRRYLLIVLWFLTALSLRVAFEFFGSRESVQCESWDAFLLVPSLLIVGSGVESVIRRQNSTLVETLLIALTAGLLIGHMTGRPTAGLITFVSALAGLALLPAFATRGRGSAHHWSEQNWGRCLQVFVVVLLASHMLRGLIEQPRPTTDDRTLTELRDRLRMTPQVRRITLIAVNAAAPASLRFLLRSSWPLVELSIAEEWSADSTEGTNRPADDRNFDELVVEWSRRDTRLTAENFANWRAMPVGDPLRYRGRQLVLYRIGQPQQ